MRLSTITCLVSEFIGEQYLPIINVAIYRFERDMGGRLTDLQVQHLMSKAQPLYDGRRTEVFEGSCNPYTDEERQMIITQYLHGKDVSLYVSLLEGVS